jgi:hypothetical protein
MARDYEDIYDLDDLNDDELRQVVRDHLAANNFVDVDDITVAVQNGVVHLAGRVGTEGELRVAERLITDLLGVEQVENELVVDPIRRAVSSEDVEEHLADEDAHEGLLLGDKPVPFSPEAEHLSEDYEGEAQGTSDVGKAIGEGETYIPPTSPTPEGLSGSDAAPGAFGEDH